MVSGKLWPDPACAARRLWQRAAPALVLLVALGGCTGPALAPSPAPAPGSPAADQRTVTVKLIALNDFHGHLEPPPGAVPVRDPAGPGLLRLPAGGIAHLASLVADLKSRNPHHVVVAAGDLIGATPFVSARFNDEPTIDLLGQLGLEVSSVGNHEFDHGRDELLRMARGGCRPPSADGRRGQVGVDTCLDNGRFAGARFQYLAANVVDARTGSTLLPATWIKRFGPVSIGFIGLTLRQTASVVSPAGVAGLRFTDEADTINALVPQLQAQNVSTIVVLIHQGGATRARHVDDRDCPGLAGDILDIADRLDPAIRLIVSGHTHREYVCRRNGRLLTQAGAEGRMVTDIDLTIDPQARQVVAMQAQTRLAAYAGPLPERGQPAAPLPAGLQVWPADPAMQAQVHRYAALAAPLKDRVVGTITASISRQPSPAGEIPVGNLVSDAALLASQDPVIGPAQIAFTNPGGLRTELAFDARSGGRVTHGMLFSVLPFGNQLVTMDLTGEQLHQALEQQWEAPQPQGGRVLQVSQGFSYRWDRSAPAGAAAGQGRRVVAGSMRLDGVLVEPQRTYRVTVNEYLANGGDNFSVFTQGTRRQHGESDVESVEALLRARSPLAPPPLGRIGQQ